MTLNITGTVATLVDVLVWTGNVTWVSTSMESYGQLMGAEGRQTGYLQGWAPGLVIQSQVFHPTHMSNTRWAQLVCMWIYGVYACGYMYNVGYICVNICMWAYMCGYMYVRICVNLRKCVYVWIHVHVYIHVCVYKYMCEYMYVWVYMYTNIRMCVNIYKCETMDVYMCICVYTFLCV